MRLPKIGFQETLSLVGYHILSAYLRLIISFYVTAESRNTKRETLQSPWTSVSGFRHGQDDELDTLKWHIGRQYIQCRLCQYTCVRSLEVVGIRGETNTTLTTSIGFNQCKGLTRNIYGKIALLRDLTASDSQMFMRRRNLHSSSHVAAKGGSQETEILEAKALEKQVSAKPSSKAQKTRKSDSFVALVKKEIQIYSNKQNTYNGLINILKDPAFLVACYEEIRSKPGNMTKGSTRETLNGITSD